MGGLDRPPKSPGGLPTNRVLPRESGACPIKPARPPPRNASVDLELDAADVSVHDVVEATGDVYRDVADDQIEGRHDEKQKCRRAAALRNTSRGDDEVERHQKY